MEMIRKGKWRMAVVDIDDSVCKDSKARKIEIKGIPVSHGNKFLAVLDSPLIRFQTQEFYGF